MHAAIFEVEIVDRERATTNLKDNLVPDTAGAPGLVAGYWIDAGEDRGLGVVVFDSEEHARAYVDSGEPPPADVVKPVRRDIGEVVAHT